MTCPRSDSARVRANIQTHCLSLMSWIFSIAGVQCLHWICSIWSLQCMHLDSCSYTAQPSSNNNYVVLICSDCYNQVRKARWLVNNGQLFLRVWRLEVWDQGTSMVQFWWEPSCRFQMAVFSMCHMTESNRALWGPYYKGSNLIHAGFTLMT